MKLNELSPAAGASKDPMRKGRGTGSGNGKTGGRGHKGQNARSGGGVRPGFEGGQMPLTRQLPKRGFKNYFKVDYACVNISVLNDFDNGAVVDAAALADKGILKQLANGGLKVLGNGELTKKVTVRANAFSESAKQKIEAAGGAAEEV
ncbi:MAG: 50S ribosomal protein L15 [Clostridiaceae bacterium]|nr:50S ribosomal protein L15 [Clostridiaceae bacterium]